MARFSPQLTLAYTVESLANLDKIWEWNAEHKSSAHADRYLAFLKTQTNKLLATNNPGRPVPERESYRYAILKRRSRGYGHVVIFEIDGQVLRVLRYFHTSQDWENQIAND